MNLRTAEINTRLIQPADQAVMWTMRYRALNVPAGSAPFAKHRTFNRNHLPHMARQAGPGLRGPASLAEARCPCGQLYRHIPQTAICGSAWRICLK